MAIVNRDKDASEQRDIYNATLNGTITGQTYALCVVPYPGQLVAAAQAVNGLSGSPNHSLWVQRMIVGTGITTFSIGNSLVATTFGTSGAQGFSLPNGPSYLLQTNDIITLSTAAANTAATSVAVTLVIKALQDIKTHFGA